MNMSDRLLSNKDFISLLLRTHKQQGKALLYTLDRDQVSVICEILYNLSTLPLSKKEKNFVLKRKSLLNKVTDKKFGWTKKRNSLEKHYNQILQLLRVGKHIFEKILS